MSERELGTYQMLWDCPACDTPKLLGLTHRHCPNCGAAQDPARRYFPSDAEKVRVEDHRYTGADKACPACAAPAAALAHNCASCGSPLDEADVVKPRREQVATAAGFALDSAKAAKEEHRAAKAATSQPPPRAKPKLPKVAIAVVLALIATVVVFFTWKKTVELEVTGHAWVRTIDIEEYKKVRESAWQDEVPMAATDLRCAREQRSTREVPDGQSCRTKRRDMGNGTFTEVEECQTKYRSEPVYDQRCTFNVEKWLLTRKVEERGAALTETPAWPKVDLRRRGQCLGCEREGSRRELYEVVFRERPSNDEKRCAFAQDAWARMAAASRWKAKSRVIGGGLDCDSLVAN